VMVGSENRVGRLAPPIGRSDVTRTASPEALMVLELLTPAPRLTPMTSIALVAVIMPLLVIPPPIVAMWVPSLDPKAKMALPVTSMVPALEIAPPTLAIPAPENDALVPLVIMLATWTPLAPEIVPALELVIAPATVPDSTRISASAEPESVQPEARRPR
jgi:hypothetical protein